MSNSHMGLVASVLNSTGLEQLGGDLHRAKLTLRITCTISFNPQSRPVLPQKKVKLRGVGHVPVVSHVETVGTAEREPGVTPLPLSDDPARGRGHVEGFGGERGSSAVVPGAQGEPLTSARETGVLGSTDLVQTPTREYGAEAGPNCSIQQHNLRWG